MMERLSVAIHACYNDVHVPGSLTVGLCVLTCSTTPLITSPGENFLLISCSLFISTSVFSRLVVVNSVCEGDWEEEGEEGWEEKGEGD